MVTGLPLDIVRSIFNNLILTKKNSLPAVIVPYTAAGASWEMATKESRYEESAKRESY